MMVVVMLGACAGLWAAENILGNGGFEATLAAPDQAGTVFEKWTTWKWDGYCKVSADTEIRHSGKANCLISGRNVGKIAIHQKLDTQAGWYKLSGYVRGINLKEGTYSRCVMISEEPEEKEIMDGLRCFITLVTPPASPLPPSAVSSLTCN
jgi:hypothetical protein